MGLDKRSLNGPIPGQSLTSSPGAAPYERPPEIDKPEDAAKFHLDRLSTTDKAEAVLDALELGIDVKTLTEGIIRGSVSEGMHSIDVGLIIAPLVHEKIINIATTANIEFDEGLVVKEDREEIEFAINKRKVDKLMAENETLEEEIPEEVVHENSPRGFMVPTNQRGS